MATSANSIRSGRIPSERIFWVLWIVVTLWLLACAFLVNGEYADGYVTIANSRYLFGENPAYYIHRGPLAAIALWPIEALVGILDVGPFDVTPYHLYSAALHSIYLIGCWVALRHTDTSPTARIMAFAGAILTVVFYCYAPYLSHDILPGLLFLLMIFVADRWLKSASVADAVLLVIVGAAVVLIKQTYALFWVAIVAYGFLAVLFRWDRGRVGWSKFGQLLGLAALSACLTWVGYAWFAAAQWPGVPWYFRPWELALGISNTFGERAELFFPADLYLRNLHNYGMLAMVLVIPGLVVAFRGDSSRLKMIAVCWLISAIFIQSLGFREVRYVLFLAPLTAILIAPAIEWAARRRELLLVMVLILAVDQVRGLSVAARQLTTSASIDPVRFFAAAGSEGRIVASEYLSFVYDAKSPLKRDSYHGIYHVSARLIFRLQEGKVDVGTLGDSHMLGTAGLQPGDRVFLANREIRRFFPYTKDNSPHSLPDYLAIAGRVAPFTLRRNDDGFVVEGQEDRYVVLVPDAGAGEVAPLFSASAFSSDQLEKLYGSVQGKDALDVSGIIVDALCDANGCRYR